MGLSTTTPIGKSTACSSLHETVPINPTVPYTLHLMQAPAALSAAQDEIPMAAPKAAESAAKSAGGKNWLDEPD